MRSQNYQIMKYNKIACEHGASQQLAFYLQVQAVNHATELFSYAVVDDEEEANTAAGAYKGKIECIIKLMKWTKKLA